MSNPYAAKEHQYSTPATVNAHVVSTSPYSASNGTFAAAPISAQPASHAAPIQAQPQAIVVSRPPANRWKDSICDWPSNLFPSCFCACCCCYGMWLNAQMAQKIGYASFQCVIMTYVILWTICAIISLATANGIFVFLIPMIFALSFTISLRVHLAARDNITECGGCFGEFCVGFWCWYCSITQMARHLYGYTKVLDGDGDPDRGDNYSPIQQV
eukprot:CAMPEP_0181303492 /NCGR_PEP_ID=MMETSP1101-20121128/8591_1 /TAXON_ID=46948 /ORGANISM="Rhodomonas abbreviata, Strain Caron Lab Isolate" /LENGTH=213 /DNA_ID=CAMNT_0023409077 /DNA_START=376 /DNA_END=1017 /DNA_ORIENTATION=-